MHNGSASAFQADGVGSIPIVRSLGKLMYAAIVQGTERNSSKVDGLGSNPSSGAKKESLGNFYAGLPEWLKGSDCKSDGYAYGGSNPSAST